MKLTLSLSLIIFLITPLSPQNEDKQNSTWDKIEDEIWFLEEDYISFFREANHKAILSLYHSQFLGWPDSELHPAGKKRAIKFLEENYPEPTQAVFNIKKEAIRVLEGVVITHYLLILSWINDEGVDQTSETRITHTWIKENSQWKIFGGMSNIQRK